MAINFPSKPKHEEYWPKEGDTQNLAETKGTIFRYDRYTNSWDIVGPDNIATTEWVLAQKKDDTTNLERAYDLVTATNDLGLVASYYSKTNDVCDTDFDASVRGGVFNPPDGDGKPLEEVLAYSIPDWANCLSTNGISPGSLYFIGTDEEGADPDINDGSMSSVSKKYKDIVALTFSNTDISGENLDWFNTVSVDDTLELSYEGSLGNVQYGIYTISGIQEVGSFDIVISLKYVGSSHPDQDFINSGNSGSTYYLMRVYKKSVTTAGATFDGALRVKYTDAEAISARPKDDSTRTFNVNTETLKISASVAYDSLLGTPGFNEKNCLVTYGHLIMRIGADTDGNRGPFLPLAGGIVTNSFGTVFKKSLSATRPSFTIRGKLTSNGGNNSDLLYTKSKSGKDYIALDSTVTTENDAVLNKSQIQAMVDGGADTTPYLPIDGGTMKGKIRGISLNPSWDNEAASKAYADTKEFVHNGHTNDKGRIWTDGNSLYFNPY